MTWSTTTSGRTVTGMRGLAVVPAAALLLGLMPASPAATVEASPSNDDYADAELVGSLPFADALDIEDATAETLESTPTCTSNPSVPFPSSLGPVVGTDLSSVWYRFEPASDSQVTIDATGSDFTVLVGVYDGHDLATHQEVACARTDWHGTATVNVDAGTSYAIQLSRFSTQEGSALSVTVEETAIPGVAEIRPFEVAAEDGTPLRGHVYLPEGDGPFAPVLEYSPYWNTAYGPSEAFTRTSGGRVTMAAWLGPLMDAGFAVALVNMRGTGESGGCMQWGNSVDRSDVATVIGALADAEWSTGKVGMYGLSFPGWSQMLAVSSEDAPALKAVVPVSPVTDPWSMFTSHGAAVEWERARPPLFTLQMATGARSALYNQTGTPFIPDTEPSHITCPRFTDEIGSAPPAWNGDRTQYFRERDLRPLIDGTDVAVFATVGLQWAQGVGGQEFDYHISQLDGVWDLLRRDRRFMLGQWGHGFPSRPDFPAMAVAWLDQHLRDGRRDGPGSVRSGVVEFEDDTGVWHTARQWPPRATEAKVWLSGSDLVPKQEQTESSSRSFVSSDQVPCAGVCLRPFAGRIPGCAGDHLVYVSEPLAQEVVIAGYFRVELTIESDQPDGTLASFLYHTDADDPCSAPGLTESGQAIADLRHAFVDEGANFPVGTPTDISLASKPLASRIPAGHRLVLTVGSAAWTTVPDPYRPRLTISTGPGTVSALTLPVVQGALTTD